MSQEISNMTDQAESTMRNSAPWNPQAPWWILLIEGILGLGIGLYLYRQPTEALALTGRLLALFLLVAGLWQTLTGLRRPRQNAAANMDFARGVVGLVVGVLVFGLSILGVLTPEVGGYILAFGMLIYGLLGVAVGLASRRNGRIRWGFLLANVLFIVLSAVIIWGWAERISGRIAIGLIVLSIFLIIQAVYLFWAGRKKGPAESAPAPAG